MDDSNNKTIVALATPEGRAGVAVIRVSGNKVLEIIKKITDISLKNRYAHFIDFKDKNNETIDQGIAIYFQSPNSFTGEDVLELHCHSGFAVIRSLIKQLLFLGATLAKPGEFSERAFLNNKIDLIQAEAISDLINASTEESAKSALLSLQGNFSKKINSLVKKIINLRMYIESSIDFIDEEIDFLSNKQIKIDLIEIIDILKLILKNAKTGSLLTNGINVVIIGKPNSGKSSLLNQLSQKDSAIVTNIAGTTRDILRENINIDGIPVHIVDTAGLRSTNNIIEKEGIKRTYSEIKNADLILCMYDGTLSKNFDYSLIADINININKIINIRNKIDLISQSEKEINNSNLDDISISAKKNIGIDLLKTRIKKIIGYANKQEGIFSARQRHLDALERTNQFLSNGRIQLEHNSFELLAEDLRQSQICLSEITGEFTSDDLLGKIFSSFCIGK
ncbi:tRNA uridine-5-carboxymethylaminomethyl(34) synthesis GTPase MnmE [Gammaproteobacteria bacterium]|nr:tRNA uridine-5-carboxymethylaminomethyl(34) synthesis GTPase MnmE [Gammaproteobacteria bacterium]